MVTNGENRQGPADQRRSRRTRRWLAVPVAGGVVLAVLLLTVGTNVSHDSTGRSTTVTSGSSHVSPVKMHAINLAAVVPTTPAQVITGAPQSDVPSFPAAVGGTKGHGDFDAVSCPTSTFCMAVGADSSGAGVAAESAIAGTDWTDSALPANAPVLRAVSCADTQHCVAVGAGGIVTTGNGGSSWQLSAPPTANTTLLGVICDTQQVCVATGISPNPLGPYNGEILRSSDFGATWTAESLPTDALGLGAVTCPTATDCIAVGASILVSSDGGQTWSTRTVADGTQGLTSISCSSATTCVAVGPNPGGIEDPSAPAIAVITNDGGQTWQQDPFPAGTATLDQVECTTGQTCFAGGAIPNNATSAPFVETTDGGQAWNGSQLPTGLSAIAGYSCSEPTSCVAVGVVVTNSGDLPVTSATTNGSSWTATALSAS